ncbi:protein FAR1-RELATED SEQUENCE 1-like [Asparagus officinalis]|uniref:protein FAR1-RELATED SEQUENCE 1-like n=1 Tax=Asparagus officinalis TaxID=4686 RepID=UPI00098E3E0E|nr:protein FAR1-RELATED SEQUENCE 1-like [Asparagus officinalis]
MGDIEMTDIAPDDSILDTSIPLDDITPFKVKEFISDEDAYNYYIAYGKKIGFGIRQGTLEKSKKASGEILSRTFECNEARRKNVPRENESGIIINRRPETRINCVAKMKIRMTSSCINKSRQSSSSLFSQATASIKDLYFQDRRESDPDFYFVMEVDHLGTMRSVFWANGRARASYLSLGDVVVKHKDEQQVKLKSKYRDEMPTYFNNWYYAKNISKCEELWKVMKEKFSIDEDEDEDSWLTRMYNLHKHWVDAYLNDCFWVEMTISQRSEIINAFFDGFVNANTSLVEFVGQYDKAVATRHGSESHEDFMTLNIMPVMSFSSPIEAQVGRTYTRVILKMFQKELGDVMSLHYEETSMEELKVVYSVGKYFDERKIRKR